MGDVPVIAEGLFSFQIGGSERVGIDLALEFKRRGYEVVCFAFQDSDGPMRTELERSGVRCLDMNYGNFKGPLRWIRYQWHFWRMLRRERVRALHVHHRPRCDRGCAAAGWRGGAIAGHIQPRA